MNIKRLDLTNFRGIKRLELALQPGINVIAGKNGVGKSGILESMAILLSQIEQEAGFNRQARKFAISDIAKGTQVLQADLICEGDGIHFQTTLLKDQETARQQRVNLPRYLLIKDKPHFTVLPGTNYKTVKYWGKQEDFLAVYYATNRAYFRQLRLSSSQSRRKAQADALNTKFIDLKAFANWFDFVSSSQNAAANSDSIKEALENAISRFLPGFSNLKVKTTESTEGSKVRYLSRLLITKEGQELELQQLSDGERGILAIVLDLARRLALAYPNHNDPLSTGQAIVLIDEIDLHLHPIWQREVLDRLEATFPQCQFILTTHSPQVIGQTLATHLIYLEQHEGQIERREIGDAFGRDTNWVLREIMGTPTRDKETMQEIQEMFQMVEAGNFDDARSKIAKLRVRIGEDVELVAATTRIRRRELLGQKGQKN